MPGKCKQTTRDIVNVVCTIQVTAAACTVRRTLCIFQVSYCKPTACARG